MFFQGFIVILAFLINIFLSVSPFWSLAAEKDDCEHTLIWSGKSPDGKWIASVDQQLSQIVPIGGATVLDVVQLTPADHSGQPIDVFSVDTGGEIYARPSVSWKQKNELDVTVLKGAFTEVIRKQVGTVRINIKKVD